MNHPFTNPFRYVPHPLVRRAAEIVMERLGSLISGGRLPDEVCRGFSEGKMLGVLVCNFREDGKPSGLCHDIYDPKYGSHCFLAAFSGSVGGQSMVDGFVPPIYDLLDPTGYFKEREAEITVLNRRISVTGSELEFKQMQLEGTMADRDMEISALQKKKSRMKKERRLLLKEWDADGLERLVYRERLVRESQHENAEYKRAKDRWKDIIGPMEAEVKGLKEKLRTMKQQRAAMSEELQKWIFRQYEVMNVLGEESSILDIFAAEGLIPPGGTGDCAAPKLLNYAFRHGLEPVAMGEFWYGQSPDTAVRTSGHFYPSCTSKCGPLLKYMLRGVNVSEDTLSTVPQDDPQSSAEENLHTPKIIFEDDAIIVVDKPSGMPSVPGLDSRRSLQEWLEERTSGITGADCRVHAVHRLDMDTSGVIIYAKTAEAAADLRRQFEERRVRKTYRALLCAVNTDTGLPAPGDMLSEGDCGTIDLPLAPDYDERPRQKVDIIQGKPALTEYEVLSINPDGTAEVLFHPVTGRTHQLRVHSAHHLGLGRPIVGDLLYGAHTTAFPSWAAGRLCLHAEQISFSHPVSGHEMQCNALSV